ncbi:MAG: hypothetical protein JSR73_09440 [Proteobacteria bacterium]|nr:hypothetical protein [Pseudomonadota bacterium]
MRRAILAVLAPAVCFSQSTDLIVQPIGRYQYTVTGEGLEPYRKAKQTCDELRRIVNHGATPASGDPSGSRWTITFDCYVPYEVLSIDDNTYKIQVPTEMMSTAPFTISASKDAPAHSIQLPDVGPVAARVEQLGREYCAKMNKTMKIAYGGFDMGPGFRVIFNCVTP